METSPLFLHLEDSVEDYEIIGRLIKRQGIECRLIRVQSENDFSEALRTQPIDLILSDYRLPGFNGIEALKIARTLCPETPFIFVSGMMGEETAIESLQKGATDYVLKDRPARLVPAIRRALEEGRQRQLNRELHQRLLEASRLQAVSTLSTGISHDFNNILTIIRGHAALLKVEDNAQARVFEISDTIAAAARRASDIVRQLVTFAQPGKSHQMVMENVSGRLDEIVFRLQKTLPAGVTLHFEPAPDLPNILMDGAQLETILINVTANAVEAMPDGGAITFTAQVMPVSEIAPFLSETTSETYVRLQVTDTGRGMNSATRRQIFEPFFTTKDRGRGTGLGLPVVYGLMHAHKGWIDVQSELQRGTVVSLYFPVPRETSLPSKRGLLPNETEQKKRETILVIEDEADVSFFLEVLLSREGYHVLTAQNYDEALPLFKSHQDEIKVIFSDIGLPRIDGITLCEELRILNPGVKIILSSGYAPATFQERIDLLGIDAFLPKPYEPQNLFQCVRQTLGSVAAHN